MQKLLEPLLRQPRTTVAGKINIPSPSDKLTEFTRTSLDLLTQLLALPPNTLPNDAWLHEQEKLLTNFPPCLLHPKSSGLISRVAASISSFRLGETKTILCPAHKALNPYLIRKIFLELTAESTTRMQRLVSDGAFEELPVNVREFVVRMQRLNSIWMQPDFYRQAYQVSPSEPRYQRVASGCEACILATIGGNRDIVRDLWASILGRRKKNREMKGWIDVVRAWGKWHENFEALKLESTGLGREICKCRKHLQALRRAATREQLQGTENPMGRNSEAQTLLGHDHSVGDGDVDVENEIVDFYANMISRTSLANRSAHPAGEVHAAFCDTVTYSGGFFHNVSRPVEGKSASVYSRDAVNASRIPQDRAEGRANTYRHLFGSEDNSAAESDEDAKLQFTDPFADPPATNHHAYRGSYYENPRACPSPPSPRTTSHENKPKEKHAPRHRRPDPLVNPFSRSSHVAHSEVEDSDRGTRCSDFMK